LRIPLLPALLRPVWKWQSREPVGRPEVPFIYLTPWKVYLKTRNITKLTT